MEVRELVTKLGFKVNNSGINAYESRIKGLRTAALALGAAFVAVGAAVFKIGKDTANFGDELAKTSQKLGISVEGLQRLKYAGELADVSFSALQGSLRKFSKTISDAKEGSKSAVDTFKQLNIDPKGIQNSEDAFMQVATSIASMEDGFKKTALAQELFGRSGSNLLPLLNSGADGIKAAGKELEELGFIMSEDTAKASEDFNDNLTRIDTAIKGIKLQIGSELLPVLSLLIKDTLEWIKANKQLISLKIRDFLDTFIKMVKFLYNLVKSASQIFGVFADAVGGTANALKILTAGALIAGVWKLAAAIGALFAIPAAPIVGLGLLALAIDDVKTAFEGGESLSGRFFSQMLTDSEEAAKELETRFRAIFSAAQFIGGWSAVWETLKMISKSALNSIAEYITSLPGRAIEKLKGQFATFTTTTNAQFRRDVLPVFTILSGMVTSIGNAITTTWLTAFDSVVSKINEIRNALSGSFLGKIAIDTFGGGVGGANSPQPNRLAPNPLISSLGFRGTPQASSTSNNSSVANNFDNNFNINVSVNDKSGVGQDVAEQIKLAVNNELGTQLRRTLRNSQNATV